MITEKQIEIAKALIGTGLINKVYHSVEIVEGKTGAKLPAYKKGAEEIYVGPDDTQGRFGYIRQTGSVQTIEEKLEASCLKMFRVKVPLRIVVFKDNETDDFDTLVKQILSFIFLADLSLVSFNTNAFQLAKQESPIGEFDFDATTFYLAVDVSYKMWIVHSTCNENNCIVYPNPICS